MLCWQCPLLFCVDSVTPTIRSPRPFLDQASRGCSPRCGYISVICPCHWLGYGVPDFSRALNRMKSRATEHLPEWMLAGRPRSISFWLANWPRAWNIPIPPVPITHTHAVIVTPNSGPGGYAKVKPKKRDRFRRWDREGLCNANTYVLYKYRIESRGRYELTRCTCPMREVTASHVSNSAQGTRYKRWVLRNKSGP